MGLRILCKFNFSGLIYRIVAPVSLCTYTADVITSEAAAIFFLLFFWGFLFFSGRCTPNITFYLRDLCAMWVLSLTVNGFTMEHLRGTMKGGERTPLYKYHSLCSVSPDMRACTRWYTVSGTNWERMSLYLWTPPPPLRKINAEYVEKERNRWKELTI